MVVMEAKYTVDKAMVGRVMEAKYTVDKDMVDRVMVDKAMVDKAMVVVEVMKAAATADNYIA